MEMLVFLIGAFLGMFISSLMTISRISEYQDEINKLRDIILKHNKRN